MSKVCTLLVGVPASGKSTWINNNIASIVFTPPYTDIISTDDIISSIATDYQFTYDEGFKDLIAFAEKVFWRDILLSVEDGNDIVIDRTNLNVKSRKRFIDMLKPHDYTFEAVVFPTPETDEWKRRLASRPGKTIPAHVLESMANTFVYPTPNEGFSKITFIELDGSVNQWEREDA